MRTYILFKPNNPSEYKFDCSTVEEAISEAKKLYQKIGLIGLWYLETPDGFIHINN